MNRVPGLLGQITKVAAEITMNYDVDVFVRFNAHVHDIEIDVYLQGWEANTSADLHDEIKILPESWRSEDTIVKRLNKVLNTLNHINCCGRVNYRNFRFTEEIIRHYHMY